MKTLVEIYDDEMILNIVTSLNKKPEKTIFLYETRQRGMIHNKILHQYLTHEIEYVEYDEDHLYDIILQIDEEDMAYDIHGGNHLAIATIAQLAAEKNRLLYYPNFKQRKMQILCDGVLQNESMFVPKLSVKDIVGLYGAAVRDLPEAKYDDDGRKVIERIMRVKRKNNSKWANFTKLMAMLKKRYETAPAWYIERNEYKRYKDVFDGIQGIFYIDEASHEKIRLELVNPDYEILVVDTGVAFEYETYYQMLDSKWFDDVDIRVNIDWNGEPFNREDPNSELDVMATKDGRLYSISCKSGKYDQQSIYEVKANAVKFGGEHSISVLCTDINHEHAELVEKARELDVLLLEAKDMREGRLVERIKNWVRESD
ncbi:MAG: DUF1887 family protein [Solobacterium sp.]|nr:DUF1887 family protein [Solobacterium sp.]